MISKERIHKAIIGWLLALFMMATIIIYATTGHPIIMLGTVCGFLAGGVLADVEKME